MTYHTQIENDAGGPFEVFKIQINQWYCFPTLAEAEACVSAANQPFSEDDEHTKRWISVEQIRETTDGLFAVPRVPTKYMDAFQYPVELRDAFLTQFGGDIRQLMSTDFIATEEEI